MLTRNIDVSQGLVNGSFATLVRLITSEQHVTVLGHKMDDETAGRNCSNRAPGAPDNLVYIERAEENLKQKGVVHRQFPIKLAFACIIHKVQGMTTTSAVVSLKHIFEPGMAYVAVSRVTSLSGLHLLDIDGSKIYANPEIIAALQTMRQLNLDDMMPLLHIKQTLSRHDTLIIVHHNTGLPSNVNDIKSHHELSCRCFVSHRNSPTRLVCCRESPLRRLQHVQTQQTPVLHKLSINGQQMWGCCLCEKTLSSA